MSQPSQNGSNAPGKKYATDMPYLLLQQKSQGQSELVARRHARKRWTVELQIRIEETVDTGKISRDLRVTTQDLSRGGYSFLCRQYLHPGSCVEACFASLPGNPVWLGIVKNCSYDGAGQHRVGVKFVSAKT